MSDTPHTRPADIIRERRRVERAALETLTPGDPIDHLSAGAALARQQQVDDVIDVQVRPSAAQARSIRATQRAERRNKPPGPNLLAKEHAAGLHQPVAGCPDCDAAATQ